MESPFYHEFNHYLTFCPLTINANNSKIFENVPHSLQNQTIFEFIDYIENLRLFWLQCVPKKIILPYDAREEFFSNTHFQSINEKTNIESYSPITVIGGIYIYQKYSWLYQWITHQKTDSLFPEEFEILSQTLDEINEILNCNERDVFINDIYTKTFIEQFYDKKDFFYIGKFASLSDNDFDFYVKTILNILSNDNNIISSLNLLELNLKIIHDRELKGEDTFNYLNRFLSILIRLSYLEEFKNNFLNIFDVDLHFF